jgi:hypothetical protein
MGRMTVAVDPRTQKAARHELRKAHTLDLLAEVLQSQQRHGESLNLFQDALKEHTEHQMRLSSSVWARLKWLVTGR